MPDEAIHTVACAARFRSKRRAAATAARSRSSCSTSSASPSAGARRCADCCGRTPASSCPAFDGRDRRWICRCPAPSISTSPPPNISTALDDGDIPLCFLFSGTVFYDARRRARCRSRRSPWDKEARFRLPVAVWRDMMDPYYPEQRLALPASATSSTSCIDYKMTHGIPTWEQALERLLRSGRARRSVKS